MKDPATTKVREIMTEDVLTFGADEPIMTAVSALEEYGISGAPVLNASDECVGVFSRADALKRSEAEEEEETLRMSEFFTFSGSFRYRPRAGGEDVFMKDETVGEWMSANLQSIPPDATVEEACRKMAHDGIHRLLVMEGKKLLGIVSSMDVVNLVAGLDRQGREDAARREAGVRRVTGQ